MPFVHLHTHSEYSLLDGAARVAKLVDAAVALEMPALALTDHGVMCGAIDFYRRAVDKAIRPIIGCEIYFTTGSRLDRGSKPDLYHLLLLAKNNAGYRNLMALVSEASVAGFYYKPQVDLELLRQHSDGLIGTSACMSGLVSKSIERGDLDQARMWAETYAGVFAEGDFFLEIQNQEINADNGVKQTELNEAIAALGQECGLPLVATNDVHYVLRTDAHAQDMLLCIGTGSVLSTPDRMKFSGDQFYLKSAEEMETALGRYPEALANTLAIAERCEVTLEFDRIVLPSFEVPGRHTEESYLEEQCLAGLATRYGDPAPEQALERLHYELGVINEHGYAAYFLIVADFVRWARTSGIGVGPGRGSAAGSIVAYTLGITNLDPIEHGLFFERFLNPERREMPDIDIDFDDERRSEVLDYVRGRYGEDKVAQIVTFNTLKPRQAVRDAGRVLGYPYGLPDRLSKMITDDSATTLAALLAHNPDLKTEYESNPDSKRILEAAFQIQGIVKSEGLHPAGVVICPDSLRLHAPVKRDTKGAVIVTQYAGAEIALLGLLKIDVLGLRTLTVIEHAIRNIKARHGVTIVADDIPLDDEAAFELLRAGDTVGVFQVESPGMRQLLRDLKLTTFGDLVAALALYRPGPLGSGMVRDFVNRKDGRAKISYYDDRLKPILEETYGTVVYQEQVMRIAIEMCGFSGAKADKLRKAMGKKNKGVLDGLKADWEQGAAANGYAPKVASQVWEDIEKFAEYAFNKSHSAAYGLLAMQTAYLKAHYPAEYMAAFITSYTGKTEKIVKYVAECNRSGLRVLPPDVNSSRRDFTAVAEGIRFGLAGIRGVGAGAVDHIIEAREADGPFRSLHDFCARVDMRTVNRKAVEALIKAGAFDSTGYTRKHLTEIAEQCVDAAARRQRDTANGQVSMFELMSADSPGAGDGFADEVPAPNGDEWSRKVKLAFEKEMLGLYVSDHPLREVAEAVSAARTMSLGDLEEAADGTTEWFAGLVSSVERRPTRKGTIMAAITLEDLEGFSEAIVFPQVYEKTSDLLVLDAVIRVRAKVEHSDRGTKLIVHDVQPFNGDTFAERPRKVIVTAKADALANGCVERLRSLVEVFPGRDSLIFEVTGDESRKVYRIGSGVDARSSGLHAELIEMFGSSAVREA
ncbi:MAG TPA: DNA polymerase III subunit alpha [Coriobacteriia bacterium]|nr:DNA polymerase III subunit alpha [Coriobacteriia bacterium]